MARDGRDPHRGLGPRIGVSNFTVTDIESLLESSTITPQVNQITYFVGNTQHDITAYCQANGIVVEGFSPLATGSILDNADVRAIADWYGKSVATVRRLGRLSTCATYCVPQSRHGPPEIRLMPTPQAMPGRRTASPTGQIAAGSRSSGDSVPNTNRDGDGRARRRTRLVLLRFGTKWLL